MQQFAAQIGSSAARRHELALSDEQIRRVAPSVFANEPWSEVSDRYRFIPTIAVVERMREHGLVPVFAAQARCRLPDKRDFTLHTLRFRLASQMLTAVGDEAFELVLRNSHDRTSGYQIDAGLFRLVCLNGLVVSSEAIMTRQQHTAEPFKVWSYQRSIWASARRGSASLITEWAYALLSADASHYETSSPFGGFASEAEARTAALAKLRGESSS